MIGHSPLLRSDLCPESDRIISRNPIGFLSGSDRVIRSYLSFMPDQVGWSDHPIILPDRVPESPTDVCAPKLHEFQTFAQINECKAYCQCEVWPYDLVVAYLVPDTCCCCNNSMGHDYVDLTVRQRGLCRRSYSQLDKPARQCPFPSGMKVTYNSRTGEAGPPQQSISSSSSAPPQSRTPVPAPEKRPRFIMHDVTPPARHTSSH